MGVVKEVLQGVYLATGITPGTIIPNGGTALSNVAFVGQPLNRVADGVNTKIQALVVGNNPGRIAYDDMRTSFNAQLNFGPTDYQANIYGLNDPDLSPEDKKKLITQIRISNYTNFIQALTNMIASFNGANKSIVSNYRA